MRTIFTNDYLECYLDEENGVLIHIWIRKPNSEEFKNGLIKVYETYVSEKGNYQLLHWLGDTRKMGVVSLDDQHWLDNVWNEMLFVKAKVRTHAVIIGDDIFSKYAMEKFRDEMLSQFEEQDIHLETFIDKDGAYEWFKSMEKVLVS